MIRSKKTGLQELVASAPELLAQGNKLLAQFNQVVSSDNIEFVSQIVRDVKAVTDTLAKSSGNIDTVVANAAEISENMKAATARLDDIAGNVEHLTGEDAQKVVVEARGAVANLRSLTAELDGLVKENRPHIRDFSRGGLPQLAMMIQEARQLFASLERLAGRIESDPGAFLYGKSGAEYEPTHGGER